MPNRILKDSICQSEKINLVSDGAFTLTEGSQEHDNACYLGSALNDAGARIEDAITDVREALKHVKFED